MYERDYIQRERGGMVSTDQTIGFCVTHFERSHSSDTVLAVSSVVGVSCLTRHTRSVVFSNASRGGTVRS